MLPNLAYELLRQNRKTLSISVKNQVLIIKSPLKLNTNHIQNFVKEKENWIQKQIQKQKERFEKAEKIKPNFDKDEFWKNNLMPILTQKIHFWLQEMQSQNGNLQAIEIKISVKKYSTKWGSCSYFAKKQKENWQLKNVRKPRKIKLEKSQISRKKWQKLIQNSQNLQIQNLESKSQNNCQKFGKNQETNYQIIQNLKLPKFYNLFQKVKNYSQNLFENTDKNASENSNQSSNENTNLKTKIEEKYSENQNSGNSQNIENSQINQQKKPNFEQNSNQVSSQNSNQNPKEKESKKENNPSFQVYFFEPNCSYKNPILPKNCELKFNLRLGYVPDFVFDYVIIHELAHLWQPNHSREFWKIVKSVVDPQNAKNWLKNEGSFYL